MQTNAGRGNRARFATTRWSLVLAVSDGADETNEGALAALCDLYWFPIYAFIRRSGRSADTAADLTQGFFTAVVEKDYFGQANRDRGRFRSFLLGSVRHFIATEFHHATRQKRGGGQPALALEDKHKAGWMRGSRFFLPLLHQVLDESGESFADMAARLHTSDGSLRVLAYRVRRQFGECLREVVADTVETPDAVDGELKYLLKVLGRCES